MVSLFYLSKWDQLRENQPNINHLDIRCRRKRFRNADKEGCQNELRSQVYCDYSLKEERFEEVCGIDNGKDEDRGEVGGENLINYPSVHHQF